MSSPSTLTPLTSSSSSTPSRYSNSIPSDSFSPTSLTGLGGFRSVRDLNQFPGQSSSGPSDESAIYDFFRGQQNNPYSRGSAQWQEQQDVNTYAARAKTQSVSRIQANLNTGAWGAIQEYQRREAVAAFDQGTISPVLSSAAQHRAYLGEMYDAHGGGVMGSASILLGPGGFIDSIPFVPTGGGNQVNASRGKSGPQYRSIYNDGTLIIDGQQPARFGNYQPDAAATGAHSRVRFDTVNGRVYQLREFNAAGSPVRDIDFTNPTYPNGTSRPGHPGPPHQHSIVPNDPNIGPRSGWKRDPIAQPIN